jgi:hypothetical protein
MISMCGKARHRELSGETRGTVTVSLCGIDPRRQRTVRLVVRSLLIDKRGATDMMRGVIGMTDAVTAMIDMTGMMTGMIDARGMIERMVRKGDHGRNCLVRKGSRQERPMRNTHPRERRWASSSLRQDPHP